MYRFIRSATLSAFAALLFSSAVPSFGQAVYGSIYGTVTDNTGAVIPNATITVTDEAKGTVVNVQSNASGEFTVDHLIPDVYDVKVTAQGFKGYATTGLRLFADTSSKIEAALTVGGSDQTVEVSADAIPQLKTDRADVSTIFSSQRDRRSAHSGPQLHQPAASAARRAAARLEPRRQRKPAGRQADRGRRPGVCRRRLPAGRNRQPGSDPRHHRHQSER